MISHSLTRAREDWKIAVAGLSVRLFQNTKSLYYYSINTDFYDHTVCYTARYVSIRMSLGSQHRKHVFVLLSIPTGIRVPSTRRTNLQPYHTIEQTTTASIHLSHFLYSSVWRDKKTTTSWEKKSKLRTSIIHDPSIWLLFFCLSRPWWWTKLERAVAESDTISFGGTHIFPSASAKGRIVFDSEKVRGGN
jgi:hypothetical protein